MSALLSVSRELPESILDCFQSRNGKQMDSDFEGKTDVVKELADFPVESRDRLQLRRINQAFRYSKQIFVGIRLDLRG